MKHGTDDAVYESSTTKSSSDHMDDDKKMKTD
jgi:hypothetical protein